MEDITLHTTRLKLIPFQKSDYGIFHELSTDPFIRKYLWDDEIITLQQAKEILKKNEMHFKEDKFGICKILLKSTQELIGYTGLWYFFHDPQPQLIYALLEPYTGMGYALEAAKRIMDYSFHTLDFDYLVAAADEPNLASQKVIERLGMKYIETRNEESGPTLYYRIDKSAE